MNNIDITNASVVNGQIVSQSVITPDEISQYVASLTQALASLAKQSDSVQSKIDKANALLAQINQTA